jgi:hypothetical protein
MRVAVVGGLAIVSGNAAGDGHRCGNARRGGWDVDRIGSVGAGGTTVGQNLADFDRVGGSRIHGAGEYQAFRGEMEGFLLLGAEGGGGEGGQGQDCKGSQDCAGSTDRELAA